MNVIYVRNVWISKKIEWPKLRKFKGKLCTLYVQNIWMCRKIEYPEQLKFNGNWVHYICTEWLDLQKNWISKAAKIHRKIVHVIYVRNGWISKKIECPLLQKFNGKLCTLYMYGTSRFAEKLNIWNSKNSTRICVRYICKELLDLKKNWISRAAKIQRKIVYVIYVRNVWIIKKIERLELRKFNGKLCTLYMYRMSRLAKKLNVKNCVH